MQGTEATRKWTMMKTTGGAGMRKNAIVMPKKGGTPLVRTAIHFLSLLPYWSITDICKTAQLMYTIWWDWTYAYTNETISAVQVMNTSISSRSFPMALVLGGFLWGRGKVHLIWDPLSYQTFTVHNTGLLTICTMLYSRSPEFNHLT